MKPPKPKKKENALSNSRNNDTINNILNTEQAQN